MNLFLVFKTKANYFNKFINQQCTEISTDSSIPSSVNLATNEIVALNPNKAHGLDGLSICMLQTGSDLSLKPSKIIFQNRLKVGYFTTAWKKTNVVPVHKYI